MAELIGRRVETTGGRKVGRVMDIELVVDVGGVRVVGLELGRHGLFDRLHILRPLTQRTERGREPRVVKWEQVERLPRGRVIVRGPIAD